MSEVLGYTAGVSPKALLEEFELRVDESRPFGYQRRALMVDILLADMGFVMPRQSQDGRGLPIRHGVFLTDSSASPTEDFWSFRTYALFLDEDVELRDGVADLTKCRSLRVPKGFFVLYLTKDRKVSSRPPPEDATDDVCVIVGCGKSLTLVFPEDGRSCLIPRRHVRRRGGAAAVDKQITAFTMTEDYAAQNPSDSTIVELAAVRDALTAFFDAFLRAPATLEEMREVSLAFPAGQLTEDGALTDEFGQVYSYYVLDLWDIGAWSIGADGEDDEGEGDDVFIGIETMVVIRARMEEMLREMEELEGS